LAGEVRDKYLGISEEVRGLDGASLEDRIQWASCRQGEDGRGVSSRRIYPDDWCSREREGLKDMLDVLSIFGASGYRLGIRTSLGHATLDDQDVTILAVRGESHDDCLRHVRDNYKAELRGPLLVVSRDVDNLPLVVRDGNVIDVSRRETAGEYRFTDRLSAVRRIRFQDLELACLSSGNVNALRETVGAMLKERGI